MLPWKRPSLIEIARLTRSTRRQLLPLLPSGPGGVYNPSLHGTRLSYLWRLWRTCKYSALKPLANKRPLTVTGGERGIRTPGTPLWVYTRFPVVPLRPLGHLSTYSRISFSEIRGRKSLLPLFPTPDLHARLLAERGGFEPP